MHFVDLSDSGLVFWCADAGHTIVCVCTYVYVYVCVQHEDATIAKDFCFKLVNAYFACFFVAFVQNNFKVVSCTWRAVCVCVRACMLAGA